MINGRYQLHEKIGQGGMGIVHRATDRLTGETVALKQVFLPVEQIMFSSRPVSQTNRELRLALAHEFQTLAGLRHPNIISVLDYGFDENQQPFFTMSYLAEAQTILAAANGRSAPEKAALLIQMLEALAYLHRRGILHRDLKPDNVLVVGDTVRVLDFGLAAAKEQATESVGSWLYMAPEVLLGQPASEASDLYTVGVLAYRLLAGTHPFSIYAEDVIGEILDGEPDWSKVQGGGELTAVIRTLLAKKAADRYPTANQAIAAFYQALGQPVPEETAVIRESYLQAATFIGRETEMSQLTEALARAKAGQGSAWLIDGESGVGKSRLLRELQTQAMVAGFQVTWGQAIQDGGGAPYQLWSQIVQQMLLSASTVDDQLASTLKQLVPNSIERLLSRPVPSAPKLSDEAMQQRLFTALKQLVSLQNRPILIILEDLQWAEESLLPLPSLIQGIGVCPFLLIGTYRNDETPNLPHILPDMAVLSLARLDQPQMETLAVAILGEAGKQSSIVDFLVRETEGNTFFVVETLRQLALETGRLQDIGQRILPDRLLPQGVREIVQRRINNVPERGQALLQLAAVAGRGIDLSLMFLLADEGVDIANWWLPVCAETAVLEVINNQWRFAHDKIRETILANLTDQTLIAYHGQVANSLVTLYGNQPAHAATIAFHWQQAQQPEQEQPYLIVAGGYAEAQYLYQDALVYYERAYALMRPAETAIALRQNIDLINKLSNLTNQHNFQRAYRLAEEAHILAQSDLLADNPYQQGLAESQHNKGNALRVEERVTQSLPFLQEAYTLFESLGSLYQAAVVSGDISNAYWLLGDYPMAEKYVLQLLNIAEQINDESLLVSGYTLLAMAYEMLKRPEEELAYEQKALQMARKMGDRYQETRILNNHSVTLTNRGKTAEGLETALQGLALAKKIGYTFFIPRLLGNVVDACISLKQFAQASLYLEEHRQFVTELGIKSLSLDNAILTSAFYFAQGNYEESLAVLHQVDTDIETEYESIKIGFYGELEKVYKALGKSEEAAKYNRLKEAVASEGTEEQYD